MSDLTIELTGKAKEDYIAQRFPKTQAKKRVDVDGYSSELKQATNEAFQRIARIQDFQSSHETLAHRLVDFKGMKEGITWKKLRLIEGFLSGLSQKESTVDIGRLAFMTDWSVKSRMCGGYFRRFHLVDFHKNARRPLKSATHEYGIREIRRARKALKDLKEVRRLSAIALDLEKTERGY